METFNKMILSVFDLCFQKAELVPGEMLGIFGQYENLLLLLP